MSNKFKIGDKVQVKQCCDVNYGKYKEQIGTITFQENLDYLIIRFDKKELQSHKNRDITDVYYLTSGYRFHQDDLMILRIPDTKIGRRIHKNNILKIEDNKIYLK